MKNPDLVIEKLIHIAIQNFNNGTKPEPFAVTAAHVFSAAAAAEFSPESADAAAFVAALQEISALLALSKYSAHCADAATKMHDATKNYHAKANGHAGCSVSDSEPTKLAFEKVLYALDNASFGQDACESYTSTFADCKSDSYRLALNAACAHYPHAYACARAAYTHAAAVAARYALGEMRDAAFKAAITSRLSHDLKHEPMDPSFFIQVMNSEAMQIMGTVLLVAGIIVLALGICGLTLAPVAAVLMSMSINATSLTIAGSVITASGTGLLVGRFFSKKKWDDDNQESYKAVEAMNAYV